MKILTLCALSLGLCLAVPAALASPTLVRMDAAITTLDHDKEVGAQVDISILPDAGGNPVAHLSLEGTALGANTTVNEAVPAVNGGFELADLPRHYILVSWKPNYSSLWKLTMDVVLQFSDGSQALLGCGKLVLSSSNPQAIVPLSMATVAHPGLIGGMEKFGFRLLSKGSPGSAPSSSPGSGAPSHHSPKEFTHMDLTFETEAHGQDAASRVEVSIEPVGGGERVAYLDITGREFEPYGKNAVVVPPAGAGFTLDDLRNEQVVVHVTPSGHGTWTTKFDAILHFADGTTAMIGSNSLSLSSARDSQAVPLRESAVAGTSILGKFERLSFSLMSKGAVTQTQEQAPLPRQGGTAGGSAGAGAAPGRAAAPQAADAFTGMDVKLWTGTLGKPADAKVEVSIVPAAGGDAEAYATVEGQEMKAGASVEFTVPPVGSGFERSQFASRQVLVKITPVGHVNWTHGLDLMLHFADGTTLLWSTGEMDLSNYKTEETISLGQAVVAKQGFLGGVEKLGFGILNHIGK
jgi:hypothetical protein